MCAALAAGLGSWGRCRGLCLPRSPPPAPRYPRCVWQAVPSACPLRSPAGTPFCAVCAFRGLGPVALLVLPVCPLCLCALPLSQRLRPSPLPRSVWRAHLAWFRCRAPVGPFIAVRTPCVSCLGPMRRLACFGGGRSGPGPPVPGFGSCAPLRAGPCVRGGPALGGGTACVPPPPGAWPGGPEGRAVALPRSVPLPFLGRHQSGCHRRCSVGAEHGLHTAPVRFPVWTPAVVRGAPLCAGAGPPACRGHFGSRRVAAWRRVAYGLSGLPPSRAPRLSWGGGAGAPLASGGREGRRPRCPSPASRGPEGGGWGGEGRGSRRGSWPLSSSSPARTPGGYGGLACSPRPWPPLMASAVAPRIPPCRVLGRGCLAAPGAGRGLAGCWWVSLAGGGGGWSVRRPSSGARPGGPRGWGAGGRSASVCLSAPPGRASSRPTRSLSRPPHCTGSRPRAAARMRSAGCPCAPAQGCWPAAGTVGVGGRLTGGMRRTAACTVAMAPLPGCRGPLGGGCGAAVPLAGLLLSVGRGGERREGGRGGGCPLSPSGPPVRLPGGCGGAS